VSRFLITGVGRSGTTYAARLLCELGLPTSHERVYSTGARPRPEYWYEAAGEVSWLAAPYVGDFYPGRVALLVREPLAWLRSWTRSMRGEEHGRFLRRHVTYRVHSAASRLRLWVEWNGRILREVQALPVFRVEDLCTLEGARALLRFADAGVERTIADDQVEAALERVPTDLNTAGNKDSDGVLTWASLDAGALDEVFALATWFGYDGARNA